LKKIKNISTYARLKEFIPIIPDSYRDGIKSHIVSKIRYKNMSEAKDPEKFYEKLKSQLKDTSMWPNEYLYKFIVSTNSHQVKVIENIFNNMGAVITTKNSKNGNYVSVSINVKMKNPEAVIQKYREVGEKVEGVISL